MILLIFLPFQLLIGALTFAYSCKIIDSGSHRDPVHVFSCQGEGNVLFLRIVTDVGKMTECRNLYIACRRIVSKHGICLIGGYFLTGTVIGSSSPLGVIVCHRLYGSVDVLRLLQGFCNADKPGNADTGGLQKLNRSGLLHGFCHLCRHHSIQS